MFCWMDSDEIRRQFLMTEVDPKEVELALGKAPNVSEFVGYLFGTEKLKKNMEFVMKFKDFMQKEENCKKIFELIKEKTTIKQVFVYPKRKHLDVLLNLDSVLDVDKNVISTLKPTTGDVYVVENGNNPVSETWQSLDWGKKGQLIKIGGIVGPKGCFYPFERPTNGTVSLKFDLSPNYESNCIGISTHFYKLHHIYSLIIGKFIAPHLIKPIFFYDFRTDEGENEMTSYLRLWCNIFNDIKSKELYGESSNTEVEKIISMLKDNEYNAGEWLEAEGRLDLQVDYFKDAERANRFSELGVKDSVNESLKQERVPTLKREKLKRYNNWRCEGYGKQ